MASNSVCLWEPSLSKSDCPHASSPHSLSRVHCPGQSPLPPEEDGLGSHEVSRGLTEVQQKVVPP